jgi:NAD(P)H-nitrite reductase large subunit
VWDAKPGRVWFEQDGRSRLLRCRAILLATGAYDRCIPFPGWTLPGVITAGACQVLVRGFAVKPGTRALVAGSGPLILPTITALLSAGVEVVAALEACAPGARRSAASSLLRSAAKLREAMYYVRHLLRRRVRLQWGMTVFAAEGEGRVQRAVIGKVDREGRPLSDTAQTTSVDLVCAGFGLVPSVELGLLLGCKAEHRDERGGFYLHTDGHTATSVAGVWAAGEIAGIGGADVAMAEGRLAAAAILQALRGTPTPVPLLKARAAARRSADALLRAFAPLPGLAGLATDDTIVCRCEDVRAREVRAAAALHGSDVRGIKMGTRAGMGPCQGRICGPCLQAVANPGAPVRMDCPVAQVPVKPVAVRTLLDAPAG